MYNVGEPSSLNRLEDYWIPYALVNIPEKTPLILIGTRRKDADSSSTIFTAVRIAEEYQMELAEVDIASNKSVRETIDGFVRRVMREKHLEAREMDLYMNMLLHINEDFDDDLLQETIGLLVDL